MEQTLGFEITDDPTEATTLEDEFRKIEGGKKKLLLITSWRSRRCAETEESLDFPEL